MVALRVRKPTSSIPIEIRTLSSTFTVCCSKAAQILNNELSYKEILWQKSSRGKHREVKTVRMIEAIQKDEHYFLTGLVPRALDYLDREGIKYNYISEVKDVACDEPVIKGIEFRDYQKRLSDIAINVGRGVIQAPTASGKSFIILRIMAAFTQENILFLVHTKDLVQQLKKDLVKFKIGPVGEWSGRERKRSRVMVATVQSFHKSVEEFADFFDVVIIDEAHHVSQLGASTYAKSLMGLNAPIKIGFTATLPSNNAAFMALEALIGPVIGRYKISEAQDDGILADADVHLVNGPIIEDSELMDVSDFNPKKNPTLYRIVYHNGVIKSEERNRIILDIAQKEIDAGRSIMINIVNRLHGELLLEMIEEEYDFQAVFANGDTKDRTDILKALESKELKCCICSVIFTEGVNIPSLDSFINAGAGKDSKGVLQRLGRILRKTAGKEKARYFDIMDRSHGILKNQAAARKATLKEMGFIK